MRVSSHDLISMWLYADVYISAHTIIILMEKQLYRDDSRAITTRSLQAGRTVLNTIFEFADLDTRTSGATDKDAQDNRVGVYSMRSLISFYPISAFFTLYYHILAHPDSEDCAEDIRSLEKLGSILKHIAKVQTEFIPISNAVNALNQISKTIQEHYWRRKTPSTTTQIQTDTNTNPHTPITESSQAPFTESQQHHQDQNQNQNNFLPRSGLTPGLADSGQIVNFPTSIEDFAEFEATFPRNLSFGLNEGFQPMGYMKAVENEFIGRNWHESWWNNNGGI